MRKNWEIIKEVIEKAKNIPNNHPAKCIVKKNY